MRKIYFLLTVSLVALSSLVMAQSGELRGKVIDAGKEPVPFASVTIELNGVQVTGAKTNFDGEYSIKPINPGKYDVKIIALGFNTSLTTGVIISADKIQFLDKTVSTSIQEIKTVEVESFRKPLIEKDNNTTGGTLTSEEIKKLPNRTINSAVSTTAGVYQADDGKDLNMKGSRSDATIYYVDGVKVRGNPNIPQSAIDQISTALGGLPAQYGDVTGGIVNITTKGPSKDYKFGVEAATSRLTDAYKYDLGSLNVSGPILSKNKGQENQRSVLGFFLSGEYTSQGSHQLSAIGSYKIKDDALAAIKERPYVINPSGEILRSATLLNPNDIEKIKTKENNGSKEIGLDGRLEFQPFENTTFSLGGSGSFIEKNSYNRLRTLYNTDHNRLFQENSYRVYGRYTQRFGSKDGEDKSLIKNAYYTIQADYSKFKRVNQDPLHKDKLFNYGYIGKFTTVKVRDYGSIPYKVNDDTLVYSQQGYKDIGVLFDRREINPVLANYTDQFFDYFGSGVEGATDNMTNVEAYTLVNGREPDRVYNLFENVGKVSNGYFIEDENQYKLGLTGSADIKNHSIRVGFDYEQRVDRNYNINPVGLWSLMRTLQNNHLLNAKFDSSSRNVVFVSDENGLQQYYQYDYIYDPANQTIFDKNLRAKRGIDNISYLDIDSYDPSEFTLDLFSADELIKGANMGISYKGYTYTGEINKNKVNFADFFTDSINRPIGAYEPIYMAGYIQDKFTFRDLIFNLGVRIDRFDANQMVLKDKYSLYDTRKAGEVSDINGSPVSHPSTIGNDYVVYVDNEDPTKVTKIVGYRNGDDFYDTQGNKVDNPNVISAGSGGRFIPYFSDAVEFRAGKPQLGLSSFKDYEPQITVMPRISFSFPVSDEALFFASYDVLSQRPTEGNEVNLLDYYPTMGGTINNPDLKPTRTINYEIGFKQKLSSSSALTMTAFYKDMKDNIQQINVQNAYPNDYTTYGNVDFGTVKGFTFGYDLRRTGNIRLNAAYTLQFADGTGSSSTTSGNLISAGIANLRVPGPLDYDQRHTLTTSVDYRYASGPDYNGPVALKKILQNAGANILFRAGSGTPYSRQEAISRNDIDGEGYTRFRNLEGSLNGSRLPWQFKVDLRVDKDIEFRSSKEGNTRGPSYLNIYVSILNLLDTKNIISVYPATGNADDDGYLSTSAGQQYVSAITPSPETYEALYRVRIQNPDRFSLPRTIRVGASYNF